MYNGVIGDNIRLHSKCLHVPYKLLCLLQLPFFTQHINHYVKSVQTRSDVHPEHLSIQNPSHLSPVQFQEQTQHLIASLNVRHKTLFLNQVETLQGLIGLLEFTVGPDQKVKDESSLGIDAVAGKGQLIENGSVGASGRENETLYEVDGGFGRREAIEDADGEGRGGEVEGVRVVLKMGEEVKDKLGVVAKGG